MTDVAAEEVQTTSRPERVRIRYEDLKRLRTDAKEAAKLRKTVGREHPFARVGVDIDSPIGSLLVRGYKGPLDDPDEIVKAARAVGALPPVPADHDEQEEGTR